MLAGGELKLQCQGQAVWKCKAGAASRTRDFRGAAFYASKRSLEMTAATWCHLATGQRLKLR